MIYSILFESFSLSVLFIGFHVVERWIVTAIKGETEGTPYSGIGDGGLAGLACVAVILFVSLVPFSPSGTPGTRLGLAN